MRCFLNFIGAIFMLVGSLVFGVGVITAILMFLSSVSEIPSETMGLVVLVIVIGVTSFFWGSVLIIIGRSLSPKTPERHLTHGRPASKHRDIWKEDTWSESDYEESLRERDEELSDLQFIYDERKRERKEEKKELEKKKRDEEEEDYY